MPSATEDSELLDSYNEEKQQPVTQPESTFKEYGFGKP